MLDKKTLHFLAQLKSNNSKEWLDEHKADYINTKENLLALTQALIDSGAAFDLSIAEAHLDPKKCITRLNRDLRFSKDKTPYKTGYYIVLNPNGKNSPSPFYYLHVEPGNCFVGGGLYNPQPQELKKIRAEISASYRQWCEIIEDSAFNKKFPSGIHHSGTLTRIPKGFEEDDPALEYLKMKGFYTQERISDDEIQSNELSEKVIEYFKSVKPLIDFLNLALDD